MCDQLDPNKFWVNLAASYYTGSNLVKFSWPLPINSVSSRHHLTATSHISPPVTVCSSKASPVMPRSSVVMYPPMLMEFNINSKAVGNNENNNNNPTAIPVNLEHLQLPDALVGPNYRPPTPGRYDAAIATWESTIADLWKTACFICGKEQKRKHGLKIHTRYAFFLSFKNL